MFSSTTTASSMTMPVASTRPSMVTLLRVKSSQRITVKVAMIEVGIATAQMSVARRLEMKSITVRLTSTPASTRWNFTSSIERWMKRDWSRMSWVWMSGGSTDWMVARRCLTVLMTSTVLVPVCLRTSSVTAGCPSRRAMLRGSTKPSSTVPRSPMVSGRPWALPTMRSRKSSARSTRPIVRRMSSFFPWSTRPPGISMFCARIAAFTWSIERPYATRRSVSSTILMARSRPPMSDTEPTPRWVSMSSLICFLAISVISRRSRLPETTTLRIGVLSRSNFATTGESVPGGSCESTVDTLSRTSCAAASPLRARLKNTRMFDRPSLVVERSSSMPSIVFSASSSGLVTLLSISSTLAPLSVVVTVTIGKSMFG